MRAYGARYLGDLRAFTKAYLLSLLAILPLILLTFGLIGFFAYVYLLLIGGFSVLLFASVTAAFGSYAYKFIVYLLVVGAHAFWLRELFSYAPIEGVLNLNLLLFGQVTFLLALFYAIAERSRIGAQFRSYFGSED